MRRRVRGRRDVRECAVGRRGWACLVCVARGGARVVGEPGCFLHKL